MKKNKFCPKCDSVEIIRIPARKGSYGSGNIIFIGATIFSAIKVTRYLCCRCGYLEEWIDDKEDIKKLIKRYR